MPVIHKLADEASSFDSTAAVSDCEGLKNEEIK